jgi:transposase
VKISNQTKPQRSPYTLECKHEAAQLDIEKGYTRQHAADNPGISLRAVGRWLGAERGCATGAAGKTVLTVTDQAELLRLRKENEQLRRARALLKKAAGIEAGEGE